MLLTAICHMIYKGCTKLKDNRPFPCMYVVLQVKNGIHKMQLESNISVTHHDCDSCTSSNIRSYKYVLSVTIEHC